MEKLLLIAIGGGVGSVLRYLLAQWCQVLFSSSTLTPFPLGTLLVNTFGSFALGFLAYSLPGVLWLPPQYRVAILVGLLGGFTTFSTYAFETFSYINDGQLGVAGLNFVLNNGLALVTALIGFRLAERIYGVTA